MRQFPRLHQDLNFPIKVVVEKSISIDRPATKVVLNTDVMNSWLWMVAGESSTERQ